MPASSYGINIPVSVNGREQLSQVDAAIRGVAGATKGLSSDQKEFAAIVRENLLIGKDYVRTLDSLRTAKSGVNAETKQLAASMQAYVVKLREAEQESKRLESQNRKLAQSLESQSTKFQTLGGSVAARIGGMGSGIPGGGFIGSQAARSIGGTGALAFGGALVTAAAIAELVRITAETAKYAQAQQNLAAQTGLSAQQTQLFGRVADIAGVQATSLTGVSRRLSDAMTAGGAEATKTARALKEMGLSTAVAFEAPERQVSDILGALRNVTDQTERYRLVTGLLGSEGAQLLPLVDSFKQLNESVRGSGVIMDDYAIKQLVELKEKADEVWLSMKRLGEMFAIGVGAVSSTVQAYENFVPGGRGKPQDSPQDQMMAAAQALLSRNQQQVAQARAGAVSSLFGIDQASRTPVERLQADKVKLESDLKAANDKAVTGGGKPEDIAAYRSVRGKIQENERQTKAAEEFASQQKELQRLIRQPITDNRDALKLAAELPKRFNLLGNTQQYRSFSAFLNPIAVKGIQEEATRMNVVDMARNSKEIEAEHKRVNSEQVREQERSVSSNLRTSLEVTRGTETASQAEQRQNQAIYAGQTSAQRRYLTGPQLAGRELSDTQSSAAQENAVKFASLMSEFIAHSQAAQGFHNIAAGQTDEQHRQDMQAKSDEAQARAGQVLLDLDALETDAKTKSIEAINKFNQSLDKLDEAMSKEFSGGFASIIMGFQNKGGQGGLSALRSFFESQESTVLKNIGTKTYSQIGGSIHVSDSSPLSKFLEGTIFGPQGKKQTVELTDSSVIYDNTSSTGLNTAATDRLTAAMGRASGAGSQTPSLIYDAQGNAIATSVPAGTSASAAADALANATPYAGSALDITAAAGVGSSLSGLASSALSGNPSADIASVGKSLSQLGHSLAGGFAGAGNLDAITGNSMVPIPGAPGFYTNESGAQQVGAIVGTAALAAGAVGGAMTISHGGAKNVSGGIAETLAAIAPLTGPAAPFVGAGAAVAGLVSSFIPDERTLRTQQISKSIFTHQYLAPQAQNITESGTGGYSDFDINGNVRTSSFSPYPIISQSYSDVPRRVDVPGHTISTFGGYQNVTGAKVAPAPTYNVTIQAMDSKDIIAHGASIADAIHNHLNGSYHPLIKTIGSQLGVR